MRAEVRVAHRLNANASIGFAAERNSMRLHAETGRARSAASIAGRRSIAMSVRFRIGGMLHAGSKRNTPKPFQDPPRRPQLLPRRLQPRPRPLRGMTCSREI